MAEMLSACRLDFERFEQSSDHFWSIMDAADFFGQMLAVHSRRYLWLSEEQSHGVTVAHCRGCKGMMVFLCDHSLATAGDTHEVSGGSRDHVQHLSPGRPAIYDPFNYLRPFRG